MKTEAVVAQSWDDLVFENRNKEYGAYSVRRSYSDRVIYALFISLSVMVLAIITPALMAMLRGEDFVENLPPVIKDGIKLEKVVIIPEQRIHKVTPPPPARNVNHSLTPVVTSQPIPPTEEFQPIEQPTSGIEGPGDLSGPSDNGELYSGTEGTLPGKPLGNSAEPFISVEQMPEYIGGMEAMARFIQRKIHYPSSARRTGIDGTVRVGFVIDADGNIVNPIILQGLSADCDAEALRLISMMPNWKAGRQNHEPVAVRMALPIRFKVEI